MIIAGISLARRLERAEAANDADCAPPGTLVREWGGGLAIFAGADSPLTRAIGLGLNGPVSETEIDALEEFFHSRSAAVSIDFCPLANPELLESLRVRGYRPAEFNSALIRSLAGVPPSPEEPALLQTAVIQTDNAEVWAATVGYGFFERSSLTVEEMDVGRAIAHSGKAACYLALDRDEPAAGAALSCRDGLALLFADSTAPPNRRKGLQTALIRRRLNAAVACGCDTAVAVTAPGSASQRNYERLGFQVAYTKVVLSEK